MPASTPSPSPPPTRRPSRKRRLLIAGALGVAGGLLCAFVPPQYQAPCHLAAKVLGLFLGGA